jgi:RNA polymerase sigma-70 factor (ECF subfamily)
MQVPSADSRIDRLFSASIERLDATSSLEAEVTALFDELRNPLLRYLSSFGLSVADCEEIIQEVFLSLFLHLRAGKPRTNIRGWIFRVAHNLGLKCRKRAQRTLNISPSIEQDAAPNPEQSLSSEQRRKRLLATVDLLPDRDRQCLFLRAEGLGYREIARVIGISVGGVALALARALARLAKADAR